MFESQLNARLLLTWLAEGCCPSVGWCCGRHIVLYMFAVETEEPEQWGSARTVLVVSAQNWEAKAGGSYSPQTGNSTVTLMSGDLPDFSAGSAAGWGAGCGSTTEWWPNSGLAFSPTRGSFSGSAVDRGPGGVSETEDPLESSAGFGSFLWTERPFRSAPEKTNLNHSISFMLAVTSNTARVTKL